MVQHLTALVSVLITNNDSYRHKIQFYHVDCFAAITCEPISSPPHGRITYWNTTNSEVTNGRYEIETTAKFSCSPGYELSPKGINISQCQENGEWTSHSVHVECIGEGTN